MPITRILFTPGFGVPSHPHPLSHLAPMFFLDVADALMNRQSASAGVGIMCSSAEQNLFSFAHHAAIHSGLWGFLSLVVPHPYSRQVSASFAILSHSSANLIQCSFSTSVLHCSAR
jgi:hypothetical protein